MNLLGLICLMLLINKMRSYSINPILSKKLSIDLSILGNRDSMHNYPETAYYTNKPSFVPNLLKLDLSALRNTKPVQFTPKTFEPILNDPYIDKYSSLENLFNSYETEDEDKEYEYHQSKLVPHKLHLKTWTPHIQGYDAFTDFLHEKYLNGKLSYKGKREFSSNEWRDNQFDIIAEYNQNGNTNNRPESYERKKKNLLQKRNMFFSKGWGPSGSHIKLGPKTGSNSKEERDNMSDNSKQNVSESSTHKTTQNNPDIQQFQQSVNRKLINRWSVPHLFGSYWS